MSVFFSRFTAWWRGTTTNHTTTSSSHSNLDSKFKVAPALTSNKKSVTTSTSTQQATQAHATPTEQAASPVTASTSSKFRVLPFITVLGLASIASWANAAVVDSIKNTAKTTQQESWEIAFSQSLSNATLKNDNKKNVLVITLPKSSLGNSIKYPYRVASSVVSRIDYNQLKNGNLEINFYLTSDVKASIKTNKNSIRLTINHQKQRDIKKLIVAIDAGHGGKDPGAVGKVLGLYEKDVTWDVAQKLYKLLEQDPNYTPTYTRSSDTFIAVTERPNVARRQKANLLISIHADSAENTNAIGSSVWVLSTARANTETGRLLESQNSSSLLGGAATIISDNPNITRDVLDLQFASQQRISTLLANSVLKQFSQIANLSRKTPQYASLGVLRSPDIPSILIETGFVSNQYEEAKLATPRYREEIALAIYNGLEDFRVANSYLYLDQSNFGQVTMREDKNGRQLVSGDAATSDINAPSVVTGTTTYKVQAGDSLYKIADKFGISFSQLLAVNNFQSETIFVGQVINVPSVQTTSLPEVNQQVNFEQTTTYTVKAGDNLTAIALRNKLSLDDLLKANPDLDSSKPLFVGRKITIPKSTAVDDNDDNYVSVTKLVDSGKRYKVQAGDNATLIARRFDISLKDLAEFNNLQPNLILVGTTLKIPQIVVTKEKGNATNSSKATSSSTSTSSSSSTTSKATTTSSTNTTSNSSNNASSNSSDRPVISHKVGRGESFSTIANKYGMSLNELLTLNNLTRTTAFFGETIKVIDYKAPAPSNNSSNSKDNSKASSSKATNTSNSSSNNTTNQENRPIITHKVARGESFALIAQKYGMKLSELKELNNLTRDTAFVGESLKVIDYKVTVPATTNSGNSSKATSTTKAPTPATTGSAPQVEHKVARGESFALIAQKYGMKVSELKQLNNLSRDTAFVGETLKVIDYKGVTQPKTLTHVVKSGENLTVIANKYGMTLDELRKLNNLTRDVAVIGQKLQVIDYKSVGK